MAGRKVELLSLNDLGDEVMEKLEQFAHEDVVLTRENRSADAQLVYQFCKEALEWRSQYLKECQRKGIQNALQKKREGKGIYGRPRVQLPEDFEEKVRECLDRQQSATEYCMNSGMAKSTFYKYANPIRQQWENEQKSRSDIHDNGIKNEQIGRKRKKTDSKYHQRLKSEPS